MKSSLNLDRYDQYHSDIGSFPGGSPTTNKATALIDRSSNVITDQIIMLPSGHAVVKLEGTNYDPFTQVSVSWGNQTLCGYVKTADIS